RSPLTHLHVFPYSDRPGTAASLMEGKVHGAVIRERAQRVREIGRSLSEHFRDRQIGTTHRGLTLDDGSLVVTENYMKLRIAAALSGMRLTFDLTPASSFAKRRASSARSLTPDSITYSNVIRLRRLSGNRLHASTMSATPYFLLIGTSGPRCTSVGACSEMAR